MENAVIDSGPTRRTKRAQHLERVVLSEITAARQALTEARGRFLEAHESNALAAVLEALERVRAHIDEAISSCESLRKTRK